MLIKYQSLFIMLWFFSNGVKAQDSLALLNQKKEYSAGTKISLTFQNNSEGSFQLFCSNSYGSTVIYGVKDKNKLLFKIPEFISNKIGVVNWKILGITNNISGQFNISAVQEPNSLETYIGPPTIEAGGTDYAMLVVIPTDKLDNPIQNDSKVDVKQLFLKSKKTQSITTKNLIAHLNIFSPLKTGRIVVSTESYNLNSKEYDVNILPAIGNDFKIFQKRNHEYADGNQITTFFTSIIRDKNNNIVSDGTFVDFFISNNEGNILKTAGTTINGIAKASIIHPDCESTWKIKAYINGISESDSIVITYKKVIKNIPITFSKDNRTIIIGPLQSFMEQMIPDGLQVKLSILNNGIQETEIIEQSKDGFTTFKLNSNIYKTGNYDIEITTACTTKTYKSIKLW